MTNEKTISADPTAIAQSERVRVLEAALTDMELADTLSEMRRIARAALGKGEK